jgi:hypothetical protein
MTTDPAARLTGEQLASLLHSLGHADSVELKLTVPESSQRSTLAALEVDPLDAQIRQVFFLDTPGLDADRAGVVVRARRVQRSDADTVVKLRPVEPRMLSERVRHTRGFGVEVDAMPGGHVCSASLKHALRNGAVRRSVTGQKPLGRMFSEDQHAFFAEHAPPGLTIDDLSVLGPIFVLKLKLPKGDLGRRIVVEMWLYPDGARILELSTKCAPEETLDVAAQVRQHLEALGIEVSAQQQTKTRTAMQFFAAELTAPTPGPATST